ncbi:MAG TPA: putative toxin-antitoxin system toxin component, PIN family [Dehalococcoidia bacterium]|nr:putative toxin-antitoxin system toxin component, PIN family [Dehalococcoidia bacterium]
MRAVFDTVVFVRALINPHGRWGRLLFRFYDRYTLVLSPEIVMEVLDVLHRSGLRQRFPQIDEVAVERALAIIEKAEVAEPTERLSVCRDPADDKFFECAVAASAEYIVSEDRDILAVGEYRGVKPVTAEDFMLRLEQG